MDNIPESKQFMFYANSQGKTSISVIVDESHETVWLTQKSMSEIFGVEEHTITYHIGNIYSDGELAKSSTTRKIRVVREEGRRSVNRELDFYNLDMIISVGYRVNSSQATKFRIWATNILKDYLTKGFVLDDDRLKQGKNLFGKDYFDELIERIREIRASERRFYQKITDIYAECSVDYDAKSKTTQTFFATVQNKLEYAITHHTAPEIVKLRADSKKPNMGLTSWKNEKKGGKILKSDVSIAKNYLQREEIEELNTLVNMYLDYAELQAKRNITMTMKEWAKKLDTFLAFNEYDLLTDSGKIHSKVAKSFAEKEYEKFRVIQDKEFKSDFDKIASNIKNLGSLPKEKIVEPEEKNLSNFNQSLKTALNPPKNQSDQED